MDLTNAPVFEHHQSRILIVDDAEFNLALLSEVLRSQGFSQIDTALDGQEAMEKMSQNKPDLVLLDLMMPNMDGFEFCEKMRADALWKDVPIIVQTGAEDPMMRMRALRLGATDLLTKPINADELMMRIEIHLERRLMSNVLRRFKERMDHELEDAKRMQLEIMPSQKQKDQIRQRYRVGVASYASTSSELGGDFWTMLPIDHYQFGIVTGDFSGHGVSAALNTFRLHTMLQEIFLTIHRPDHVLEILNQRLCHLLPRGQFATLFVGVMDTRHEKLHYAAAGCPSPMKIPAQISTPSQILDGSGILVGIQPHTRYEPREVSFGEGDSLLLYSDALIEMPNIAGQFLKEERVMRSLEKAKMQALEQGKIVEDMMVLAVRDALHKHTDQPLMDDLTIAAFHYYS